MAKKIADADDSVSQEQILEKWESLNAIGKLGTPEEFADVVVFLASKKASHITGTTLQIDGGFVKSLL